MDLTRRIAYYELWAETRPCDQFPPEAIAAGALVSCMAQNSIYTCAED
jgi:hypothetical protein